MIVFGLSYCGTKQNNQLDFPQEIAAVYSQKRNVENGQSLFGTDFFIEFVKPLEEGIFLQKVYFRNQETKVIKENSSVFVAHFYPMQANHDFILDSDSLKEYGNKAPIITQPKFELKSTEAVLEYKIKSKTFYYKIIGIKEKPIIVYPSRNKPKN